MIICDECDRALTLADLAGGGAQEQAGRLVCADCIATAPPARDAARCDGCGVGIAMEALRQGVAGAREGRLLCPKCRIRADRNKAEALDIRLVGAAVLLFVAVPLAAALAWSRLGDHGPTGPTVDAQQLREAQERLAAAEAAHEGAIAAHDRRLGALERDLKQARIALETARSAAEEKQAGDKLDPALVAAEAAYRETHQRAMSHADPGRRELALLHVAEVADPLLTPLVEERLSDDVPRIRALAARLLGTLGARRSTHLLLARLEDEDPAVRDAAVQALSRITGRPAESYRK